jgi:H+/Cl- antiporter ClcA
MFHLIVLVVMWVVAMFVYWLTKKIPLISGSGIPQSRGVFYDRFQYKSPWKQFVGKFVGSLSAIGIGLSLGREGPSVQIGALGASIVSKYFKTTPTQRRYLVTSGASAGLSAAFSAPLASVIFLIEDSLGWTSLRVVLPALISCIISGWCANLVFTHNIYSRMEIIYPGAQSFDIFLMLLGFAILGALFGKAFNIALFKIKNIYKSIKAPVAFKILAVIGITYIFGMQMIDLTSGGEDELISQALTDEGSVWWMFGMLILKMLFTALSYATGLCGSLLLPLIVMGGLLGKAYALLLVQMGFIAPECTRFFTLIGMSVMFVSVVRAPVSSMMLILEMTGQYAVFYPMIIVGTLTYLFGEYLGLKPVYGRLYEVMLDEEKDQYDEFLTTQFEISQGSIMVGHTVRALDLPESSKIISIKRDDRELPDGDESAVLQVGDIVRIKVRQREYEGLFRSIRAMANE